MTSRLVYEGALIELDKVNAPNLLLEDFNYFFNKAIDLYVNKRYNIYDINQLTSDDIGVLKTAVALEVKEGNNSSDVTRKGSLYSSIYEFDLPTDYLHLLNCVCEYKVTKPYKCYDANTYIQFPAKRLTSDSWSTVINNIYTRPTYKNPYYYLHNINRDIPLNASKHMYDGTSGNSIPNSRIEVPTNPLGSDISSIQLSLVSDKDGIPYADPKSVQGGVPRTIDIGGNSYNAVERIALVRYGNSSNVRLEIRYGKDNSLFQLERVYVDYIKAPQHIRLSQEQLDLTEDTSQMMEFPDYVCQEIINELVHIIMEHDSNRRLPTHVQISQSVANPTQQQEQPQKRG